MKMSDEQQTGLTRRSFVAGAAAAGFGAGFSVDRLLQSASGEEPDNGDSDGAVAFYGPRQAGIATPAQEFVNFASFDVRSESVEDLRSLLTSWTEAAAALTGGEVFEPAEAGPSEPSTDTGEALGLGPQRLTITFGFGPSLFGVEGRERFGLGSKLPESLRPLPPFQGDALDLESSGGDLCIQACGEDAQVTFHAVHVLTRLASSVATLRWSQAGFGRTSSTSRVQPTPRNLMGFKDGTANIRAEDDSAMDRFVWVGREGPGWLTGGTYLVCRKIKILFDVWDATSLEGQEQAVGRYKVSGAPLGKRDEFDPLALERTEGGHPVIPADAHVRLAASQTNGGQRILRRGYSYTEPAEPESGQLDAGLFFLCFQRNPVRQFVPIQDRLARLDALSRHVLHVGSAVFACPPGATRGGFIGEGLFAS